MPIFAVTYFFESCQKPTTPSVASSILPNPTNASLVGNTCESAGWTETWYRDFPDIETALARVSNPSLDPDSYLEFRLALLPDIYYVPWVRVSTVPPPGYRTLAKVAAVNRGGELAGAAAQTSCVLMINFTAVVTVPPFAGPPAVPGFQHAHYRHFPLRGLPLSATTGNLYTPTPAFDENVREFCNFLTRPAVPSPPGLTPWLIRYETGQRQDIVGLTVNPDNARKLNLTQPAVPYVVGNRIIMGTSPTRPGSI